jgi:hypothetical protein
MASLPGPAHNVLATQQGANINLAIGVECLWTRLAVPHRTAATPCQIEKICLNTGGASSGRGLLGAIASRPQRHRGSSRIPKHRSCR